MTTQYLLNLDHIFTVCVLFFLVWPISHCSRAMRSVTRGFVHSLVLSMAFLHAAAALDISKISRQVRCLSCDVCPVVSARES
jgi:hypothetical protein